MKGCNWMDETKMIDNIWLDKLKGEIKDKWETERTYDQMRELKDLQTQYWLYWSCELVHGLNDGHLKQQNH
jgi:hypothetical protein